MIPKCQTKTSNVCHFHTKKNSMTDAEWAADTMGSASLKLRQSCNTLVNKHFECEHTRLLHIQKLKMYRRDVMKILRNHYLYDEETDHTWCYAHVCLCNCLEDLSKIGEWCPILEDERLLIYGCVTHLYRKRFSKNSNPLVSSSST